VNLKLDAASVLGYASGSQQARRITEAWVALNSYCPSCGNHELTQFPNNTPVGDFFCRGCKQEYELKSSKTAFRREVLDGTYASMLRRIQSLNNPNFFLLNYSLTRMSVENFLVIPRHFFVPRIIRKRAPLAPTAKRAGWVGCNILLEQIPEAGKIFLVRNGSPVKRESVLKSWTKTSFLSASRVEARGWTLEIMKVLDKLPNAFVLSEVYAFENLLKDKFPANRFIRDKIRQQLQILRDQGLLEFKGRGQYRKTSSAG